MTRRPRGAAGDGGPARRTPGRGRGGRTPAAGTSLVATALLALALVVAPALLAPLLLAPQAALPNAFVPAAVAAPGVPAPPVVTGNDEQDRYVGTGALLLPRGSTPAARETAAACPDCSWRLTTSCLRAADGSCNGVVLGCGQGAEWLRVWLSRGGGGYVLVGTACIGPGGPVTVGSAAAAVRDTFVRDLPPLALAAQPAAGAVARLPLVFRSGQPAAWPDRTYPLLGFDVTVHAVPTWTWAFGDGAVLATTSPGGRWPDTTVAHAYRTAGPRTVVVETSWTATFRVDGLGPFPVTEPVRQRAAMPVAVGEGRAVLVR